MKKDQFIKTLRAELSSLSSHEVDDIIRDQEEFIQDAVRAGRTEDAAVESLGDPVAFANSLKAEMKVKNAEVSPTLRKQVSNTFGAVLAILALAPLNLLVVLGPFLLLCVLLFTGWATSVGMFVASWGVMIGFLTTLVFMSVGAWTHASLFFFTLGCIGATFLAVLLMVQITRVFVKATLSYLRWNLQFVQGRKA